MKYLLVLVSIVILFSFSTLSQECINYHKDFCPLPDYSFYYDQQSKGLDMFVGEKIRINIIFYASTDYYLSVCGHRKFKIIQFQIIDPDSKRILYDNAGEDYVDNIIIKNKNTRNLIVEVSIPRELNKVKKNDDKKCVGILLASRLNK